MKLSIQSAETMWTLTIEVSDYTYLDDLKWQIANMLSPAVPRDSIRLYRNREDELLDPSFSSTLHDLGVTSGDLIFFSVASTYSYAAIPILNPGRLWWRDDIMFKDDPLPLGLAADDLLKRVMEAEEGEARGVVDRLVITVHAVFLESGFVVSRAGGKYGSLLPKGWDWAPVAFSIPYTFPDLAAQNDAKVVILKFSAMGKYVSVDGFVRAMREREEDPPHSLRLETVDVLREREEKDVFKLWRTVKDGLALPLLIDFCDKNGLPLPPCFRRLPAELKIKILEFLPAVDVARAACTYSELKYLSSNDELWKQKFVKEFGLLDEREPGLIGCGWRDKFAKCWAKAKDAKKRARLEKLYPYGIPPKA